VAHHARVRALGRAGGAHRVGEELLADPHVPAAAAHGLADGLDRPRRDGRLHEHGRDAALGDELGQVLDVRRTGFARRRDALQPAHVEAVRAAEVVEGVVRGDDDAPLRRDARGLLTHVGVQLEQLVEVALGVAGVGGAPGRVQLGERVAHALDRERPEPHVEPDVRVVQACELRRREQPRRRHTLGHGDGAPVDPLQDVRQLRLQVETVVEDEIGLGQVDHVALARLVDVRVDARPHQPCDLDALAADPLGRLRDHAGRRHDPNRAVAFETRDAGAVGLHAGATDGNRGGQEQRAHRPHRLTHRPRPGSAAAATCAYRHLTDSWRSCDCRTVAVPGRRARAGR
jgi:hypothetical protein